MTQDEIIEMARQLGICELTSKPKQDIHYSLTIHEMESFANLVARHEREACAKIVEVEAMQYAEPVWAFEIVNDIRARGNT
jgi:hypothetical protein